jgi:hypothetical protein
MKEPKDKTYYIEIDGKPVRVRAAKKPDKKMIKALTALVKAAYNMKIKHI